MRLPWPSDKKLKKINAVLLVLIILINGYVILVPFWPNVEYTFETKITQPVKAEFADIDRSSNRLIIPKLQLEEKILENRDASVLDDGIWRRPNASTPDKESNTVIVGHRFTYNSKPPFYHLDKLSVNDQIIVVYDAKLYIYKVSQRRITHPNDQTVEAASQQPRLTVYTCDPLWTAENRLVYTSDLERVIE
ncbi:class E sortase [Candidatus Parcubacteria bacterium]|nr:class E sortase [Candidatus Parcubacteria bacterium]